MTGCSKYINGYGKGYKHISSRTVRLKHGHHTLPAPFNTCLNGMAPRSHRFPGMPSLFRQPNFHFFPSTRDMNYGFSQATARDCPFTSPASHALHGDLPRSTNALARLVFAGSSARVSGLAVRPDPG